MPVPKIAGLTAFLLLLHIVLPARADAAAERALLEARLAALETVLAGDVCADPDGARAVLTEGQDYTANLTACTVTVVNSKWPGRCLKRG